MFLPILYCDVSDVTWRWLLLHYCSLNEHNYRTESNYYTNVHDEVPEILTDVSRGKRGLKPKVLALIEYSLTGTNSGIDKRSPLYRRVSRLH